MLIKLMVIALAVLLVNLVWNGVMPAVFGLPPIHYGQAFLLLLLSKLLFGGLGGLCGHARKSRWHNMTSGERRELFERHNPFSRGCRHHQDGHPHESPKDGSHHDFDNRGFDRHPRHDPDHRDFHGRGRQWRRDHDRGPGNDSPGERSGKDFGRPDAARPGGESSEASQSDAAPKWTENGRYPADDE
jgi:hypothetical protein